MDWLSCQNAVLGAVLIQPNLAGRLLAESCTEEFEGGQRAVYTAISELFSENKLPDAVLVNGRLNGAYHDLIYQLLEITPSAANFEKYLEILKEKSRMSKLRNLMSKASLSDNISDIVDLMEQANEIISTNGRKSESSIGELLLDFYDRKMKKERYIKTGMDALDQVVRTKPGSYVVIGATPGTGKTALALQMAVLQAKTLRVGYYTFEGSKDDLADRIIASASCVGLYKMNHPEKITNDDWRQIGSWANTLSAYGLEIIEASGWGVSRISHHAQSRKYDVIYVDYLQLVKERGKDRYATVTEASIKLREMANRNKIVVYALSQVARLEKSRKSPELNMSDLRESGQIEQDADVILLMYLQDSSNEAGNRIMKIAKNRTGIVGSRMEMEWNGLQQRFSYVRRNWREEQPTSGTQNVPPRKCVEPEKQDWTVMAQTAEEIKELENVFEQMRMEVKKDD